MTRGIDGRFALGAQRLAEDEFLDCHAGKGRQRFDLPMLLWVDFNSQAVHTPKIDIFIKFVKQPDPVHGGVTFSGGLGLSSHYSGFSAAN